MKRLPQRTPDEVDLDRGYISWRSPLANALMKGSSGDRVERAPDLCRFCSRTGHTSAISLSV